jgi:hypothetical protein
MASGGGGGGGGGGQFFTRYFVLYFRVTLLLYSNPGLANHGWVLAQYGETAAQRPNCISSM